MKSTSDSFGKSTLSKEIQQSTPTVPASTTTVISQVVPPLEVSALQTQRTQFQTRSVVRLSIDASDVKNGDQFSLINDTTTQTLIDGQTISLLDASSSFSIDLYPTAPGGVGEFAYGANALRLEITDAAAKESKISLVLHDFVAFSETNLSFESGLQRDSGLQGEIAMWSVPAVAEGSGSLVSSFVPMVNQ